MQQSEYQTNTNSRRLEYLSALNLIMAMFRLAAQDLKYGNEETKQKAKNFLNSAWFTKLCDGMDLDPSHVRNIIITSTKVSIRESYE